VRKWLPALFIAADLLFTMAVYGSLPDRVATHFGMHGPDGWSGRANAAWLLPGVAVVTWLALRFIPRIDPRHANYAAFRSSYDSFIAAVVLVLVVVHVAMLGLALGWPVPMDAVVSVAVGGLLVLLGLVLPRAHSTWFFGIRTPWTLSNEEVWRRTHRVGGRLMVLCGLLVMSLGFIHTPAAIYAVIGSAAAMILFLFPYSYFVWREIEQRGKGEAGSGKA
jgi:uncharacterized membrane protein